MNEITVTIHKIGTVTCALSGKETEGVVVSFGEYKQTPLSWRSFKSLLNMRLPSKPSVEVQPVRNNQPVVNNK